MTTRPKNRGVVLLRRSTAKQLESLEQQLNWALGRATELGLRIGATPHDLEKIRADRLVHRGDIYCDDAITGANMRRPGLTALLKDIERDRTISHLLVYRRDRVGRPQNPIEGMGIERAIREMGVTIVFLDQIVEPVKPGDNDLGALLQSLLGYSESGRYLVTLAENVIRGQLHTAKRGGWSGGRAPYGFARVLVDDQNQIIQELPPGRTVRQPGHLVKIMPNDKEKIALWIWMLKMHAEQGWGASRIAKELNFKNIPSPDAGRLRTDLGVLHRVTGKWNSRTVLTLLRNRAIIGETTYGVQSEGAHRRVSDDGSRPLGDEDRHVDQRPKIILNPARRVVVAPTGFTPSADFSLFESSQKLLAQRAVSQRGVSRTREPGKYPLAMCVWDATPGCGHPMYAKTSGNRPLYVCGRYMKTNGACCEHNAVDGEGLLRFVLKLLPQLVDRIGGRDALAEKIRQIATAESVISTDSLDPIVAVQNQLRDEDEVLRTMQRNLARAKDDETFRVVDEELKQQRVKVDRLQTELVLLKRRKCGQDSGNNLDQEISRALKVFDDIHRVADDPAARSDIKSLMRQLNLRVWLRFADGKKQKRKIRLLAGGVVTTGDSKPLISQYGESYITDTKLVGAFPTKESKTPTRGDFGHEEGVSFTMINRGDKI